MLFLSIGVVTAKRVQGVLTNILYDSHARVSGNERYGPRYGEWDFHAILFVLTRLYFKLAY